MISTNNKFSTMNKHFFVSMLLSIMMLCTLATNQSIFAQKMTLTVTATSALEKNNLASLGLSGKGEVTINWGDGKKEIIEPHPNYVLPYYHYYKQKGSYTITITDGNIICLNYTGSEKKVTLTSLNISNNLELEYLYCSKNNLTKLNISNNKKLKNLDCSHNQLTNLDVSNNKNLEILNCSYNQLDYSALNALFKALPENSIKGKKIILLYNPGLSNCDHTIINNRGWEISAGH